VLELHGREENWQNATQHVVREVAEHESEECSASHDPQ
jgi:hypothetical protein